MLDRLELLIGKDKIEQIKRINILLVGLGGVGSYTLESLIRCGIENITIIDYDIIDITNLNRQIITDVNNIGLYKVNEAYKRIQSINPATKTNRLNIFLDENSINNINLIDYDYVIDACDSLKTKVLLINKCLENDIKIITSCGSANKMDMSKISITKLSKTTYDPLAKSLRKLIDKDKQNEVIVVSSIEEPIRTDKLGSNSFVPACFGLYITSYIINDIVNS